MSGIQMCMNHPAAAADLCVAQWGPPLCGDCAPSPLEQLSQLVSEAPLCDHAGLRPDCAGCLADLAAAAFASTDQTHEQSGETTSAGGVHRLAVNITAESAHIVRQAKQRRGISATEVLRRALGLYGLLETTLLETSTLIGAATDLGEDARVRPRQADVMTDEQLIRSWAQIPIQDSAAGRPVTASPLRAAVEHGVLWHYLAEGEAQRRIATKRCLDEVTGQHSTQTGQPPADLAVGRRAPGHDHHGRPVAAQAVTQAAAQ